MPENIRLTYDISQDRNAPDEFLSTADMGHTGSMRNLSVIRRQRRLSQTQLADMSGLTQATVSRIESGGIKPSYETVLALAGALGVHPGTLFDASELQERVMTALAALPPDKQAAAVDFLEAMAADSQPT